MLWVKEVLMDVAAVYLFSSLLKYLHCSPGLIERWGVFTFPLRCEYLMSVNVSSSHCGTQINVFGSQTGWFLLRNPAPPAVTLMWNDPLNEKTRWGHESFSSSRSFSHISNCESSWFHGPFPRSLSAWKRVKFSSGWERAASWFCFWRRKWDGGNKVTSTQVLLVNRSLPSSPLHRELRLHGPDRSSEVGPEEHPRVRRRSWESHYIWTELR